MWAELQQRSCGLVWVKMDGTSEDCMGGAAANLGDSAVADEDMGLLPAALTSAGMETTSSPAEPQEGALAPCGGRRTWASLPYEGEEKMNIDEGDLFPDIESPTAIRQKLTAAKTSLQNSTASSRLPRQEGKEVRGASLMLICEVHRRRKHSVRNEQE
ncbi:hypothetical protein CRENBAI_022858 [Crenichthys baileyi]|uniref:Uncharacterized protein n=1 Tax=Crenichthys baileyi TaxID=28760 RepID=A0AAV9RHY4_9TELE